jgi:hypothetical protein
MERPALYAMRTKSNRTPSDTLGWFENPSPVFEEAEIVAFLDSISSNSLKDIRDKAIFQCSPLFLVPGLCPHQSDGRLPIMTSVAARAGYGFKKNEEKNTRYRCTQKLKKRSIFGLNALT